MLSESSHFLKLYLRLVAWLENQFFPWRPEFMNNVIVWVPEIISYLKGLSLDQSFLWSFKFEWPPAWFTSSLASLIESQMSTCPKQSFWFSFSSFSFTFSHLSHWNCYPFSCLYQKLDNYFFISLSLSLTLNLEFISKFSKFHLQNIFWIS